MNTGFKVSDVDIGDLLVPRELLGEGGLWGFGYSTDGGLGNLSTTSVPTPLNMGSNWKTVSSSTMSVIGIKMDGSLWGWGDNGYGQLGINDRTNRSSPVQILGGGSWKSVSCGYTHSAAIKMDGSLWACGYNHQGQLGTNDRVHRSSPVQTIAGGNDWKMISCGDSMTAAIKTNGTLWVYGYNNFGQLGINNTSSKSSPVQTITGGNDWSIVSTGSSITGAIKTDGTLWMWGAATYGCLGNNNDSIHKSSPVQTITGGNNWKTIACAAFCAATKTDGTLWVWGSNNGDALGLGLEGAYEHKSSPVQTAIGGYDWKYAYAKNFSGSASKTDGSIYLWGQYIGNALYQPTQYFSNVFNGRLTCAGEAYLTIVIEDI